MVSIKQVEAFYQSAQLGSFVAAAQKLNTTQSNISKRIQELEYLLGLELFDRGNRTIRLTPKGEELLLPSRELLETHQRLRNIGSSTTIWSGPFRFGVTEAVTLTWLPDFSAILRRDFPGVIPITTTDTSHNLNELLLQRKIDFAIATERQIDASFESVRLYDAERVWVASPKLIDHDRVLTVEEMSRLPMLGHGDISQQRSPLLRFLQSQGISANIVTTCTSISALARMAIEGIGITYLHRNVFAGEIEAGRLKIVKSEIRIPPIRYVAAYRADAVSPLLPMVAKKTADLCSEPRTIFKSAS